MEAALPLKSVVLFIACGTLVFIIVFIFAKRQITRYALKSRGPHITIGSDAPKTLKQEIERRLRRVGDISYEPQLLSPGSEHISASPETCHFLYRMKAVDALVQLDAELKQYSTSIRRCAGVNLRSFLLEQRQSGPLEAIRLEVIEQFSEAYDHARHDPAEFQHKEYQEYMDLLGQLIEHIRNRKNKNTTTNMEEEKLSVLEELAGEGDKGSAAYLAREADHGQLTPTTSGSTIKPTDDLQTTYRPASRDRSAGALCMMPGELVGSAQLDRSDLSDNGQQGAYPTDPHIDHVSLYSRSGSCSSRSSSHIETQV